MNDSATRATRGPRQAAFEAAVETALAPSYLEVLNESDRHGVPPGSETHFRVTVVSEAFAGQRLVARHRAVQKVAAPFFAEGLHALALHTFTPEEWGQRGTVTDSPNCRGGNGL
jgi:BolA protein